MKIEIYDSLPDAAAEVRKNVFINEQGFKEEFDDIDEMAVHIVMFNEKDRPIATCRLFKRSDEYILGRLAVIMEYRGKGIGEKMIEEAERYISQQKNEYISSKLVLHAQCRVRGFYEKMGFDAYGNEDEDEGCPHIWMQKNIV